ncbi:hypothetical protein ACOME3_003320 [Neoechinorhynchus agilis]
MLQLCYPRADVNVSKSTNHLLKGPFCIHPKTGIVSVPLKMDSIDCDFPPADAPNITQLVADLNITLCEDGSSDSSAKGYKQTRLAEYVDIFESFVNLLSDEQRNLKKSFNDFSDAIMGTF